MTRTLTMTATAALLAGTAAWAQSSGTITGRYDADNAVWTIGSPDAGDLPESGWRNVEDGIEVTMVGLPGPVELQREAQSYDGALVITFTLEGQPQELAWRDATVMMVSDAHEEEMLAHPINIDLQVTAAEMTGEDLAIAGDIVATLTPGGLENLTIESEDAVLIDANFQGTLTRRDGEASGGESG
jgi:hypothetical protein